MKRCATVDEYIKRAPVWRSELKQLRKILRATDLEEAVKWGGPCYTIDGKNVVGLGAFKSYVGLWFFQGALLSDRKKVLISAQRGKTKALRQWRFESKDEIDERWIRAYVKEAIAVERKGLAIKPERGKKVVLPRELEKAFRGNARARACFKALTPGKRREYAEYIADAKQEETKLRRMEKILPMILAGKGLNDRYRTC